MKIQKDTKITDMGSFLSEIENKLFKEGAVLQSLAKTWFEEGDEHKILCQSGLDISTLARELRILRKRLCKTCQLQSVTAGLSLKVSSTDTKSG